MSVVASRDLRNHTREVLSRVAGGERVTVTVNGEPVAELGPPSSALRPYLRHSEALEILARDRPDQQLKADMAWISAGDTDDLGPID